MPASRTVFSARQTPSVGSWRHMFSLSHCSAVSGTWRIGERGLGSIFGVGKNRAIEVKPEDVKVTYRDVGGADEAIAELQEIIQFLKEPEQFTELGGHIPKGVLLVGPPGTGKTLL